MSKIIFVDAPSTATGFQTFSPWEYHLIEIANNLIGDKYNWETRIATAKANLHQLVDLMDEADEPVLYKKTLLTHFAIKAGKAVSTPCHLDATASGSQIQACFLGCEVSAFNTNLLDPKQRIDLYTKVGRGVASKVNEPYSSDIRNRVKKPIIKLGFGSTKAPFEAFSNETARKAFLDTMKEVLPAGEIYRNLLRHYWNEQALYHQYGLPDGSVAHIKVIDKLNVAVLHDHFNVVNFERFINTPKPMGAKGTRSIIVNPTHSMDGYFVGEMVRRCNYDPAAVQTALWYIQEFLTQHGIDPSAYPEVRSNKMFGTNYLTLIRSKQDAEVFAEYFSPEALIQGWNRLKFMSSYEPFPVLTIHDSFGARYQDCNIVRWWYKEFLAELADSDWLGEVLDSLGGRPDYSLKQDNLGERIRQYANYALS